MGFIYELMYNTYCIGSDWYRALTYMHTAKVSRKRRKEEEEEEKNREGERERELGSFVCDL